MQEEDRRRCTSKNTLCYSSYPLDDEQLLADLATLAEHEGDAVAEAPAEIVIARPTDLILPPEAEVPELAVVEAPKRRLRGARLAGIPLFSYRNGRAVVQRR